MSKKLLPLLIALVFALAGCLGITDDSDPADGGDGNDDGDDGTDGTGGDGTGGDDGNVTSNEAPSASLDANVTKGSVPLDVELTLDGEDPDGDDLSWSLVWGDGNDTEGDGLPATLAHNFTTAGNFTIELTVSDGESEAKANTTIQVVEASSPESALHRFFLRGTGDLDAPDPLPTGIGIDGSLALEPGSDPRAVQTTGPVDSLLDDDLVIFTSDALEESFTVSSGTEAVSDRNDEEWVISQNAGIHFCSRGNANGVFNAAVYEVGEDGTETLVLENAGRQFAGIGPEEDCIARSLSFSEDVDHHVFAAGSQIKIQLSPDVFLGSVATQLLYNGEDAPNDSSLDLVGFFS